MFAAPLTWIALRVPGVGLVQTTYLFNMIVTAVTAALLFLYALRLGYGRDVALLIGGLFGVATIAWPYAGYFYSEPLMGLFLTLAAYFGLAFLQERKPLFLLGGGLSMGWAVVTRLTNAPLVPVYYAYVLGPALIALARSRALRSLVREGLILSLGVGAGLGVIALYNFMRFLDPFRSGYADTVGFWTPLFQGLYGLFVSPEKSLFLFAPVLILAPLSLVLFLRRHRREGVFLLIFIAIPTVTFAKWMDWEGGLAWGPRYLVSIVPLAMILAAPGLDWVLHRSWPWKAGLALLAAWSVAVQVLGASVHFGHYLRVIRAIAGQWTGFPWAVSPPIAPFVFSPGIIGLDLVHPAWFHLDVNGTIRIDWGPLVAVVALTLMALAVLLMIRRRSPGRVAAIALSVIGLAGAVGVTGYALHAYYSGPNRGAGNDYVALVDYLDRNAVRGDVLLISSHMYMGFFMNETRAPIQWYSLLSKGEDPSPDEQTLLERLLRSRGRIWLAIDRVPALGLPRPAEKWLTQHAYKIEDETFSDYCRLLLYQADDATEPRQSPRQARSLDLGHGVRLMGEDVGASGDLGAARPGDALWFSLWWQAAQAPDGDFTAFAQLLNASGQLVWQTDRTPADGFRPTTDWRPGDLICDNYGLRLSKELEPGHYRLVAGMYDRRTMQRLPMTDSNGQPAGDTVEVAAVNVVR